MCDTAAAGVPAAAPAPAPPAADEEESSVAMWIGVPDGGLSKREQADPMACKLGGFPVHLPSPAGQAGKAVMEKELACRVCGDKMFLLVQAYCPKDGMDRIFYVYTCASSYCHKKNHKLPWRVWLLQQKEGAADADEEEEEDDDDEDVGNLPVPAARPGSYPEMALDTVPEPMPEGGSVEDEMAEAARINEEAQTGGITQADLDDMEAGGTYSKADEQMARFQTRLQRCPQQVLRWGYEGEPMWMGLDDAPSSIPRCGCGGKRAFELQILPTVVYALSAHEHRKPNANLGDEGLDFGTVCIYTCPIGEETEEALVECHVHVCPPPIK
eukprot:TRINITY_DN1579_c0_g1_i1.p1 TRINITY_DN1579_c0_g1~~TRINITY_DN1579_c0_g1_i1.p1  ORF type:complete len:327 (+),score=113.36 TRINITY_DN1579_c0_g1_i1:46-1026(+)